MRGQRMLLALSLVVAVASEGRAADYTVETIQKENYQPPSWAPTVSMFGSLGTIWTDNAYFSRDNRVSDWFGNSDLSLRLDGRLTSDLTYRFYVRSDIDAFSRESDASASMGLWGARLNQNISGWRASAIFENRYEFANIYGDHLFTAYDVKGAVSRDFVVNSYIVFSPFMQARYRFADRDFPEYFRLDFALGIEARINERWAIVSSPFFEAFWFTKGINAGRQDQIYSVSLGVKYNFTPSVALTTSIAFEERFSNVAIRHYRNIDIGPRLQFAF